MPRSRSALLRKQASAVLTSCLLAAAAAWVGPAVAQAQPVRSVKDLKAALYTDMPMDKGGDACVRLLTATGTVGCAAAAAGRAPVEGPLRRLDALLPAAEDYPEAAAVYLLPPSLLADFLLQCQASPGLAARVRGVLLEPGPAPGYSQAAAAPLAEFALYSDRSYAWNPTGKGLNDLAFPFPIFLLDNATAADAARRAVQNTQPSPNGALHFARMHLAMEAASNSSACIRAGSCLPLGGHSVLATLPRLPPPPPTPPPPSNSSTAAGTAAAAEAVDLPAIWVLSQFDSSALFHEAAVGAESPVSGLIAMLAAVQLLGRAGGGAPPRYRYRRRLVFAALAGEPWGLMGSKRLLWELEAGNSSMAGFSLAPGSVAGVLEVGQVGRARRQAGGIQLYSHYPRGGGGGDSPPAELLDALAAAAGSATEVGPEGVGLERASEATPGLPPTASAASFVRVAPGSSGGGGGRGGVPAVLLSDFDAAFRGSTFQSQRDAADTVDAQSIAAAALVLARAAHALALGGSAGGDGSSSSSSGGGGGAHPAGEPVQQLPVDYAALKGTVEGLMQCFLNATEGLNCPLAAAVMTPVTPGGRVSHYLGILRTLTSDPQTPDAYVKSDTERFIYNWMAFALAPANSSSTGGGSSGSGRTSGSSGDGELQRCQPLNATGCPPGLVCAGFRGIRGPEGLGFCLEATVRFVPSYSTSLRCEGCRGSAALYDARWRLNHAAAEWEQRHGWPADPVWVESNWPTGTPALQLFLREAPGTEAALLAAGMLLAAASVAVTLGVRAAYYRKLKQQ